MICDSRLEDVIESCALKASLSRTCFSHPSLLSLQAINTKEQMKIFRNVLKCIKTPKEYF